MERALDVLASTADSLYRQRGRAHVTRSLLIGGEILHKRLATADQAVKTAPSVGEETGRVR